MRRRVRLSANILAARLGLGRKLNQRDALGTRPLAGDPIHAPRVPFDEDVEMILRMQAIKPSMDESGVGELPTTADQNLHTRLLWLSDGNLSPVDCPSTAPNDPLPSSEELRRIFEQASARRWSEDLRFELGYRHMIHLADVFEGWAFDRRFSPEQAVKLAGWADSIRRLAEEVGPDWDPPRPDGRLSIVGFIGRKLLDE